MADNERPAPEEIILYAKDPKTKIATITFSRPEFLNAPTAAARLRYADLVIASEDALFGHPSFRYYGWGPRMWTWVQTMGLRKFQEMVFTGRPFTADEMFGCNFLNKVVPRDQLEAEVDKYALACARNRPLDTVFMQKAFFEMVKQYQGEYLGSLLSAFFESMGSAVRPDGDDLMLSEAIDSGLADTVKDNDAKFPPDFRLSKSGRAKNG